MHCLCNVLHFTWLYGSLAFYRRSLFVMIGLTALLQTQSEFMEFNHWIVRNMDNSLCFVMCICIDCFLFQRNANYHMTGTTIVCLWSRTLSHALFHTVSLRKKNNNCHAIPLQHYAHMYMHTHTQSHANKHKHGVCCWTSKATESSVRSSGWVKTKQWCKKEIGVCLYVW